MTDRPGAGPEGNSAHYMALERKHSSGVYPMRDLVLVRGSGARVWDMDGREYIDCVGGHGVASLGHCHPGVAKAVAEQSQTLVTCPGIFYNDRRAELLAFLTSMLPEGMDRVFLSNSGTEAIEAAIKFARLSTGKPGIVGTMRGFHGRTLGALSATWEPKYRKPVEPLVAGFTHVPFDNLEAMREAVAEDTAAVMVEIIQGEGGVRPGSNGYFKGLRSICDETGVLLIIDEVQTGFARTGRLLACEHPGIKPDILCLGKAIAGGVPMGATVLDERVAPMAHGMHGSTFGGNPLACAAALAALRAFKDDNLAQRSRELGDYLMGRLRKLSSPSIREVRGLGLMVGVELKNRVQPILLALMERGVLALPAGPTVLRLLPPLVIERSMLDCVVEAIDAVLQLEPAGGIR